jgi:putative ABC transport system substrate-binding protein
MKRRTLLAAGSALLLPGRSHAQSTQQPPLIGVLRLNSRTVERFEPIFRRDMARLGWQDGRTIRYQYVFADGQPERLDGLAAELVRAGAQAIVTFGHPGIEAAQRATRTVPIVGLADDMVGGGLVQSARRPGGNTTGVTVLGYELDAQRLELLREMAPRARRVTVVHDPSGGLKDGLGKLAKVGAQLGLALSFVPAQSRRQVEQAFETIAASEAEAVAILASPFLNGSRADFIERMAALRLPAVYEWPETVEEGGLIAYGTKLSLCFRHLAVMVDRILHGDQPAELPVEQPRAFTLSINAGTARTLGLPIPPLLLLRADTVVD